MRKFILSGIMAALLSGCAGTGSKTPEAPWGFTWGQTPAELKALNLEILTAQKPVMAGNYAAHWHHRRLKSNSL